MHEGHRQVMIHKLLQFHESLQDHELLEIMLFYSIPRKNTNEIAHRLIDAFGSLRGVFNATEKELQRINGVGKATAAYIKVHSVIYDRIRFSTDDFPKRMNFEAYSAYLQKRYRGERNEIVEIFCIDPSNRLKVCKRFTSFHAGKVELSVHEIGGFLSSVRPYAVLLAHNHPDALCTPSLKDEEFTKKFATICSMHGTQFYDHIIVGENGVYSYYNNGRMESIRKDYEIGKIFGEIAKK